MTLFIQQPNYCLKETSCQLLLTCQKLTCWATQEITQTTEAILPIIINILSPTHRRALRKHTAWQTSIVFSWVSLLGEDRIHLLARLAFSPQNDIFKCKRVNVFSLYQEIAYLKIPKKKRQTVFIRCYEVSNWECSAQGGYRTQANYMQLSESIDFIKHV